MDEPFANAKVGVEWAGDSIRRMRAQLVRELGLAGDEAGGALATRLAGFGADTRATGKKLTTNLTLPIVGFGAAATAAFMGLESGMANVATLIPQNEARIQELTGTVQDLSVEVAKSTDDISGGLYQTVSAFGDTADTAAILETNAKAAAAGLASTTDSINLTSAVTKAYGDTSADAVAQVADLSLLTVRLGQTTFPELASSMGRVTPLAAGLGVSMEELFGTMATFTGVTGTAAEVSTQLRGMLQALMAPTADMQQLFDELGVASGEALIEQRGLIGATEAIVAAAESSGQPLQSFIGSIEGQTFALAGAGAQADVWTTKTGEMSNAAGTLGEAFDEVASTDAFALKQSLQEVTTELQGLGADLAPIVADVASFGGDLVGIFSDLPGPIQNAAIAAGGLAATAGPALYVIGGVAQGAAAASRAAQGAAAQFQFLSARLAASAEAGSRVAQVTQNALVPGLGIATGLLAAGGVAYAVYANQQAEADRAKKAFIETLDTETGALTENTDELLRNQLAGRNQEDDLARAGVTWEELTGAISDASAAQIDWDRLATIGTSGPEAARAAAYVESLRSVDGAMATLLVKLYDAGELNRGLAGSLKEFSGAAAEGVAQMESFNAIGAPVRDALSGLTGDTDALAGEMVELDGAAGQVQLDPMTGELREVASEADTARADIQALSDLVLGMGDAQLGFQSATLSEQDAASRVAEAQKKLSDAAREHGWSSQEAADAQRELERANLSLDQAQLGTAKAAIRLDDAIREQIEAAGDAGGAIAGMRGELDALIEKYPAAEAGLIRMRDLLDEVEGTRHIQIELEIGPPPEGWEEQGHDIEDWQALVEGLAGSGMAGSNPDGGRAFGGLTSPGSMYEVNERGPEVWTSGGRTFMLADQVGEVHPLTGGGMTVNHNYDGIPADQAVALAQRRTERTLALAMAAP